MQIDPQSAFSAAFGLHRAGRLDEAEAGYRAILAIHPDHVDSHHLLGVIATRRGQHQTAIDSIGRAIALRAQNPVAEFHNNLAASLRAVGRLDDAIAHCRSAIALKPGYAEAHNNLSGLLEARGLSEEAALCCRRAITLKPDYAAAHFSLGKILQGQGRVEESAASYRQAISLQPQLSEAHSNLSVLLRAEGALDEAALHCRRAVALRPDQPETYFNLGLILTEQNKPEEAVALYRQALTLKPDYPEALNNLGLVLMAQGRLDEAVAAYREALVLNPNYADAHNSLGVVLAEQDRLDDAIVHYGRAIALAPGLAEAHTNLGQALVGQHRIDEALECFRRAQAIRPEDADPYWNESLALLLSGNFQAGWRKYEWRWRRRGAQTRCFDAPHWGGGDLKGRTILLHAEQGLGDTFQFIRYAPLLRRRGATVIVECQPSLANLLRNIPEIDRVIARGETLPRFDCHAPLLSLPLLMSTDLPAIPSDVPYLFPIPDRSKVWGDRMVRDSGLTVGLVWRGNPKYRNDRKRSLAAEAIAPLLSVSKIDWVSIQADARPEEIGVMAQSGRIQDHAPLLTDWNETAALIANLDLVITVDTAVAHLAGALGKPTWVLLPFAPDWRWLLGRSDSPWYPTVTLFRQPRAGGWEAVLSWVKTELENLSERSA